MASPPFHAAIPRYHQIAQQLRLRAASGALAGKAGLTERALCDEFGVSRTTVRQALAELKKDGVLQSRRGVGTRYIGPGLARRPYTRSSGDPLHAELGTKPRILAVEKAPPPEEVRKFLGLVAGEAALRIDRVHDLDGTPLSMVVGWLSARFAPALTKAALRQKTLHEIVWERYRLLQKKSTHSLRVARADARLASQLGIALSDPVLHIRSLVHLDDGRPFRWTDNYFREDRYEYTAEMLWKKPTRKKT